MSDAVKAMAKGIKSADKSWFNEDYDKQAKAAIQALAKQGYVVVPLDPSDSMVEKGKAAMTTGRHRPEDILKAVYQAMLLSGRQS